MITVLRQKPDSSLNTVRNHLLSALPADEWQRIRTYFKPVLLKARRILHHWNMPMEDVYFVETGLISVVARDESGSAIEVWIIGCEGMTGIPVVLGGGASPPHRRVVLASGAALHVSANDLRRAMAESPTLFALLLRYVQVVLMQTSQIAACNARHSIQKRFVRWLLMAHTRLDNNDVLLTHDTLSNLLGVRRASVTKTMANLEKAGLIGNTRGRVHVLDVQGLETAACSCYRLINAEYQRVLHERMQPDIMNLTNPGKGTANADKRLAPIK